jgi:hypothetical protein
MDGMSRRLGLTGLLAGVLALLLAGPAPARGHKPLAPLNQYTVSHIKPEALARAGFDLHEGFARGRGGRMTIVATPRQAAALRRRGARVTAPYGTARTLAAAPSPLKDPTHGYDVFRPWSLEPAPCPTTCATPNIPLRDWYHQLARRNRDIVKEVVYGHSLLGQPLIAYKVTRNARRERNGRRPAVLYNSTQHAREWIAAEVERRLFAWFLSHRRDASIRRLLGTRELWFVPIVNPDGYDYTFVSKATRLWRKNLRDNNGDGQITNVDGVDTNRNWPTKWNWDNEGASNDPADETYRGKAPASEPEVRAMSRLERRIRARFQIDYHSFAQLILYPEGWQVETPAADTPLNAALAGDDDHPAVAGFDPDVSAELYTTNGDVTDDALKRFRTEATTVELDGGTGPGVGGTVEGPDSYAPGGFVFQDSEAAVQAEFDKNLDYALDLARTAGHPDRPSSHLGNTAPDFVPTTFPTSYGSPQTVEVDAKRSLGPVRAFWQVGSGRIRSARTRAYPGGERYGEPGVYYHRLRAQVRGPKPGDSVKVWFAARGRRSASFTYTVKSDTGNPVLLMVAEDYTGNSSALGTSPYPGPRYRDTYAKALQDAGARYDVYDVDAEGRTAPSYLGVLSHYRAVIWETGEDLYTREPGQPGGTGVSKLLDDEVIGARDYLNDGGKLLVAGKYALQGGWGPVHLNPLGAPPHSFCNTNQATGNGDADDPPGQAYNCVLVSNDFQQYWLGAYLATTAADSTQAAAALPFLEAGGRFGTQAFTLNGADSAANQDNVYSFLTTSSILKPDAYPQFASEQAIKFNRPPAFDPPTGSAYAFSQSANQPTSA